MHRVVVIACHHLAPEAVEGSSGALLFEGFNREGGGHFSRSRAARGSRLSFGADPPPPCVPIVFGIYICCLSLSLPFVLWFRSSHSCYTLLPEQDGDSILFCDPSSATMRLSYHHRRHILQAAFFLGSGFSPSGGLRSTPTCPPVDMAHVWQTVVMPFAAD